VKSPRTSIARASRLCTLCGGLNSREKKIKIYKERSKEKRREYLKKVVKIQKKKRIYVDETGFDTYYYREYAWAPRGKKIYGEVAGRKFARKVWFAASADPKYWRRWSIRAPQMLRFSNSGLREFCFRKCLTGL
jgi:hypothetical protein